MVNKSGAHALVDALKVNGTSLVVGITGHTVMEVVDELANDGTLKTVYPRTETTGAFIAYGYNKIKNGPEAVCLWHVAGVPHAAPAVMTAFADSVPMVTIAANVVTEVLGTEDFQDTPSADMYAPITKWSHRVQSPGELPEAVNTAFAKVKTGRARPVLLDIPFDHLVDKADFEAPKAPKLPTPPGGDPKAIQKACDLLLKAKNPVIIGGGGVVAANAGDKLRQLAELLCVPVASGRSASKGVLPEDHPLALGTTGSFGWPIANTQLAEADCWFAIGSTFSQIGMQDWSVEPAETIVHIDIDPKEIGKIYEPTIGILGDAGVVLDQILDYVRAQVAEQDFRQHARYPAIEAAKTAWLAELEQTGNREAKPIDPFLVMHEIAAALPPEGIVTGGAGNNGEFAVHTLKSNHPTSFLLSQKYSPVGCSFPIALGAKLAAPDRPVVCVEGDGGALYNITELATAVMHKIPVVLIVMNDGNLNANRQIAGVLFDNKQVWTKLNNPDWVAVAKAFGAEGERVEDPADIQPALKRGLDSGMPYVIDMVIDPDVRCPITGKLWKIRW